MIYFIAAIDTQRGMANDNGIPWQGKTPSDVAFFRKKTMNSTVLMGYGTYVEFDKPLSSRQNLVATSKSEQLHPGFTPVKDARQFLQTTNDDVWVIGGAGLFAATLDLANELYITQLQSDFQCTKFFPEFKDKFDLKNESGSVTENNITFTFQVWKQK